MPETGALKRGVVGLAFSIEMTSLLLIRKQRPASQAGKLNGVGGKLEPGEEPIDAMVREFQEETGLVTLPSDWELFAVLTSPKWEVTFFRGCFDDSFLAQAAGVQLTHEQVEYWDVNLLPEQDTLCNLRWLVPFCEDTSPYELPLRFQETE